jgi:hypothetical protein
VGLNQSSGVLSNATYGLVHLGPAPGPPGAVAQGWGGYPFLQGFVDDDDDDEFGDADAAQRFFDVY